MATMNSDDQAAYDWIIKSNPPDRDRAQIITHYDNWSSTYDQMLNPMRYKGPSLMAEEAARLVPEDRRQEVRVLDVAAGTGLVGRELLQKGFKNIDGLEPSEGMMKLLKKSGIYNLKYQELIGVGEVTVPYDTYDVVICCGSMGENRVPLEGIDDMIHFAKPKGVVIIGSALRITQGIGADMNRLEPYMALLEQKGLWRKQGQPDPLPETPPTS